MGKTRFYRFQKKLSGKLDLSIVENFKLDYTINSPKHLLPSFKSVNSRYSISLFVCDYLKPLYAAEMNVKGHIVDDLIIITF